eukprot:gene24895-biopygen7436
MSFHFIWCTPFLLGTFCCRHGAAKSVIPPLGISGKCIGVAPRSRKDPGRTPGQSARGGNHKGPRGSRRGPGRTPRHYLSLWDDPLRTPEGRANAPSYLMRALSRKRGARGRALAAPLLPGGGSPFHGVPPPGVTDLPLTCGGYSELGGYPQTSIFKKHQWMILWEC